MAYVLKKIDVKSAISIVLFCLLAMLCLLAHTRFYLPIIDDAFITYRYAANLARGNGLVYNAGERVLGTTTPGYAILLAGVGSVFSTSDLPDVSLGVNAILLIIAGGGGLDSWKTHHWKSICWSCYCRIGFIESLDPICEHWWHGEFFIPGCFGIFIRSFGK